jgi:hypothetical protein
MCLTWFEPTSPQTLVMLRLGRCRHMSQLPRANHHHHLEGKLQYEARGLLVRHIHIDPLLALNTPPSYTLSYNPSKIPPRITVKKTRKALNSVQIYEHLRASAYTCFSGLAKKAKLLVKNENMSGC